MDEEISHSRADEAVLRHSPAAFARAATAAVAVRSPELAVFMTAAVEPWIEATARRLLALGSSARRKGGTAVLEGGIKESGLPPEDFEKVCQEDPKRLQLTIRAIEAGQNAYTDRHVCALAKALAAGVRAEDADKLDEALLIVAALADMEVAHVRLLDRLSRDAYTGGRLPLVRQQSHSIHGLSAAVGANSAELLPALIGTLERVGAIEGDGVGQGTARQMRRAVESRTPMSFSALGVGSPAPPDLSRLWTVTSFGLLLLNYLGDLGEGEASGADW